jgi:hypothetical protein
MLAIEETGQCGSSPCSAVLTWSPPVCGTNSHQMNFIYDDGSAETGEAFNPPWSGWLGNKFPLTPDYIGFLNSFDIYFLYNPAHGNDLLTLDVFDSTHTLIGSSEPFPVPDSNWVTVDVNNIPFQSTFYGMVKWENISNQTNYLGYDTDGPNASDYYDYMILNGQWITPANFSNCELGIFLIRATATIQSKKKQPIMPDSTVILGYNIFKANGSGSQDFVKINGSPITDTTYTDTLDCIASYYITTVFTTCESDASAKMMAGCYGVGIPGSNHPEQITVFPNPSNGIITISNIPSGSGFILRVYSPDGRIQYSSDMFKGSYDLRDLSNGTYLLSIQNERGSFHAKLIISK